MLFAKFNLCKLPFSTNQSIYGINVTYNIQKDQKSNSKGHIESQSREQVKYLFEIYIFQLVHSTFM